MYYKNGKSNKSCYFGKEYIFNNYEFSKIQQWLEVGQRLQKIYMLHQELRILLQELVSKHGPILQEEYDKVTGFTTGTAKPIITLVERDKTKYLCRLIEQTYNKDLNLIISVCPASRNFRTYKNLQENMKIYSANNQAIRILIEKNFDYITLDSLQRQLLDFWDELRRYLDDITDEIIIPVPTRENKEFFNYFLQARDNYCEGNKEMALAIIRKAIEDILTKLWILQFDNLKDMDFNQRPDLDNLPGYLKSKGILEEQEFREAQPFIKYGNAGIHVKAEIPIERLEANCKLMINNGINFINSLTKKYYGLMGKRKYLFIKFTKTGYSIGLGKIEDYAIKEIVEDTYAKNDVKEFQE
jgi:hypothetical protein